MSSVPGSKQFFCQAHGDKAGFNRDDSEWAAQVIDKRYRLEVIMEEDCFACISAAVVAEILAALLIRGALSEVEALKLSRRSPPPATTSKETRKATSQHRVHVSLTKQKHFISRFECTVTHFKCLLNSRAVSPPTS